MGLFRRLQNFLSVFFVAVLVVSTFAQDESESGKRLVLFCSTTQVADFARNVVGDQCEIICVLGAGEDPHTYQPGADDLANVGKADLCIENGLHLEGKEWMKTLASNAGKPLVTCTTGLAPLKLDDGEKIVNDPHAWFDPTNAWIYTKSIRDAVSKLDPANEAKYHARAELYKMQLRTLDGWIKTQVNQIPEGRRCLVTHHDAFGYFCQRYNFKAASPLGWTTSEIAGLTPQKQQEVVNTIRELNVKAIFVETTLNPKVIEGIADLAGVKIGGNLYSDAMGASDTAGETYLGMMRENVLTIVSALK